MPYKRPLGCRQAFGIKNKIAKTQGNQFFHIFLTPVLYWANLVPDLPLFGFPSISFLIRRLVGPSYAGIPNNLFGMANFYTMTGQALGIGKSVVYHPY
jgi:hypothetical protein